MIRIREEQQLKQDCIEIFRAALKAADAAEAVRRHMRKHKRELTIGGRKYDLRQFDRVYLLAVGKASVRMSAALEGILGEDLTAGLVITKHGHLGDGSSRLQSLEAGHPVPDRASEAAAKTAEALLRSLNRRDLLVVALSGGASALLAAPAGEITLAAKRKTTELLLSAGANIQQINTVRKHLSRLKGGGLARLAYPAAVASLVLSDVVGDGFDAIGSGVTAADPSTFAEAQQVLDQVKIADRVPRVVRQHLERGERGEIEETGKPGDVIFESVHNVLVGSNKLAIEAAAKRARQLAYRTVKLASGLEGEARHVARVHARILSEVVTTGSPVKAPACLLSGGETTVTLRANGKGGRNQEFALAAALAIDGLEGAALLSAGTDGTDGPTDAAGAFASGRTVAKAKEMGVSAADYLARHDSYPFFDALGDLVRTGPTGTNVMDIHIMLAAAPAKRGERT